MTSNLTRLQIEYIQACEASIRQLLTDRPEVAAYMQTLTPETFYQKVIRFGDYFASDDRLKQEYHFYMTREYAQEWKALVNLAAAVDVVLMGGEFSDSLGEHGTVERIEGLVECHKVADLGPTIAELMWDWNSQKEEY